uniref:Uncharacterized protein n=1 Tax=Panagrolaimus sp. PS1159 TaxID=55785 RepID=A0AC35GD49_9BILA
MGNSGYYRPIYPGQTAPLMDYYQTYQHPTQAAFYHHPRDFGGIYEYPYISRGVGGFGHYGSQMPYGYYGGNEYGYSNDQPGMFRGALDGAIKGTIAGAFGL